MKTFADTVGNILSHVNHFQCIEIFPDKIPVIFDQIASVQQINATDVTNVYAKFFDLFKFSLPYSDEGKDAGSFVSSHLGQHTQLVTSFQMF